MYVLNRKNVDKINEWLLTAQDEGVGALIDKEEKWTSFDVVAKLRSMLKIKKVGHAGTLDPLATGLLIICFGKGTKKISEFQDLHKKYTGIIKLGATTITDDAEGKEENLKSLENLSNDFITSNASKFVGRLMQIPPKFSAKKIDGVRLYKSARANIDVIIKPNEVEIYKFEIDKIDLPFLYFTVDCSKGTYIRSLARDLGEILECGAYLYRLRRSAIGQYSVEDALKISEVEQYLKS
ncbi:MAG: tRNA pseudouridine(55) synthase TruB [FCB group bacterium]|jgi:tRNA pseudouridine55 synthase